MLTLQRLLTYAYWLEPVPGQPGLLKVLYYVVAALTACSMVYVYLGFRSSDALVSRRYLWLEVLLCAIGLTLVAAALAGVPLLSMRLLVFAANSLAILCAASLWLSMREPVDVRRRHRFALVAEMDRLEHSLPNLTLLALLTLHSVGLLAWCVQQRWPLGFAPLLLVFLLSPQLLHSLRTRRWCVHIEALAPLLLVYSVLGLRVCALATAKLVFAFPHFFVPQPWDRWLSVDIAALLAVPWAVSLQLHSLLRVQRHGLSLIRGMGMILTVMSLLWSMYTYLHLRTRGLTGSDPYCYAQMAVDLVEQGVPVHRFPLVKTMQQLGVFGEAGVHLGYHLPFAGDQSATVWPIGQSLLLAVGYALCGEVGLYITTPLLGVCSLLALAALSLQLSDNCRLGERWAVAGLAVFLLSTSYAQIERLVVPMSDAAAQLFTTLTVVLWMQALCSRRRFAWAVLAGLAFSAAYWVRHTQLVLGLAFLAYAALQSKERGQRLALLAVFGISALLAALPDLLYHRWVMGNWLRPESLELRHFGWGFVGMMFSRMARDLVSAREFLYLAPMVVYGAWRQWQCQREKSVLLGSWMVAVVVVHLPYEALRLRDLLSIFPVLCWWAAFGMVGLWPSVRRLLQRVQALRNSQYVKGFCYGMVVTGLLLLRSRQILLLARASDIDAFGHLNGYQRAGFALIGQDTDPAGLIGASLNSGSIELHGERTTFRPAVWSRDEMYTFVDHMLAQGQSVYLLQDGLEMRAPLAAARARYDLQLLGRYDIPFYHTGGGSSGALVPLYRLYPSTVAGRAQ